MTEAEFSDSIDCCFPYHAREKAIELMDRALQISTNAAFIVLYELCMPPRGTRVKKKLLAELIDLWDAKVDHPLAQSIVPIARVMARGELVSVDEAKSVLETLAPFTGQYAALGIIYFSCDDRDGVLEAPVEEIRREWDQSV